MRKLALLFILFGVIIISGCVTEEENAGSSGSHVEPHAGQSACH